jgi:hypothetical protein
MEERRRPEASASSGECDDPHQYCPNCGARGVWQKCKLICVNERCAVRIILACVD